MKQLHGLACIAATAMAVWPGMPARAQQGQPGTDTMRHEIRGWRHRDITIFCASSQSPRRVANTALPRPPISVIAVTPEKLLQIDANGLCGDHRTAFVDASSAIVVPPIQFEIVRPFIGPPDGSGGQLFRGGAYGFAQPGDGLPAYDGKNSSSTGVARASPPPTANMAAPSATATAGSTMGMSPGAMSGTMNGGSRQ